MQMSAELIYGAIKGALNVIKTFIDKQDFAIILDKVLNGIESKFKEDSLPDRVAEEVTGRLRARFQVEDSNPDN